MVIISIIAEDCWFITIAGEEGYMECIVWDRNFRFYVMCGFCDMNCFVGLTVGHQLLRGRAVPGRFLAAGAFDIV